MVQWFSIATLHVLKEAIDSLARKIVSPIKKTQVLGRSHTSTFVSNTS